MTYHDEDLAKLAARIENSPTNAKVIHRVRVDAGDLAIVHVAGEWIDTHVLILTDPVSDYLLSLALFSDVEAEVDVPYDTGQTIHGARYLYSIATGGASIPATSPSQVK